MDDDWWLDKDKDDELKSVSDQLQALGPPSNMTSQTSNHPPPPAACGVKYRDEFQHILILIYKIISIIKIVYCQFNA